MISLKVASELKGRVKELVLIGTNARFVQSDDFEFGVSRAIVQKIHKRMQKDFEGTLEWFYKFCFSLNEHSRNEFSHIMKLVGDFIEPFEKEALLKGLEFLMDFDVRYTLDKISVPTLLIHGGEDRVCPPEATKFLASRIKNVKVEIFPKAGHAPFLTEPDKVNKLIEDFIT